MKFRELRIFFPIAIVRNPEEDVLKDLIRQSRETFDREMRSMLEQASSDNRILSEEISKAVHGMQFQDRVNQRLEHVREALDDSHARLSDLRGEIESPDPAYLDDLMTRYTMHEERSVAHKGAVEAAAGDVELF